MTPPAIRRANRAPDLAAVATRAQLLLRLAGAPRPSIRHLAAELELKPSAVDRQMARLAAEGLVVRGKGLTLTPAGRTLAVYLQAHSQGESSLRRLVRKHFGRYCRRAVSALRSVARQEDDAYAVCREGLYRRTARGREPERKASACAILLACRRNATLTGAARAVGLETGALEQRLSRLLRKAKAQVAS